MLSLIDIKQMLQHCFKQSRVKPTMYSALIFYVSHFGLPLCSQANVEEDSLNLICMDSCMDGCMDSVCSRQFVRVTNVPHSTNRVNNSTDWTFGDGMRVV